MDGEHWSCDGKAIYEYKHSQKLIIERPLPQAMQGKFLTESPFAFHFGPLPLLKGVTAQNLKQRFWVRIVTPEKIKADVWLELYPRFAPDAAQFQRIEVILRDSMTIPLATQLYLPNGKSRTGLRV